MDRQGARPRRRIGLLAGMQAERFDAELAVGHGWRRRVAMARANCPQYGDNSHAIIAVNDEQTPVYPLYRNRPEFVSTAAPPARGEQWSVLKPM